MKLVEQKPIGWMFYCPGCRCNHYFDSRWTFNGNEESPTFQPSLLLTTGWAPKRRINIPGEYIAIPSEMLPDYKEETIEMEEAKKLLNFETYQELSKIINEFFDKQPPHVCHSFVTDGKIRFLSDCTHDLADQTVPMEDLYG